MSARPAPDDADPLGYYAILGVSPRSTMEEIQAAYRREAKRWHPDRNPSTGAQERMAKLNEAYEVLGDPVNRPKYDRDAEARSRPRPVVSPAVVNFGSLRVGERVTRTVIVANAGGPCGTVRVDPEFGSWFRLAGAQGGASPDVLAELDFEAFADPSGGLSEGTHTAKVRILLDGEAAEIVLHIQILGAPRRAATAPAPAASSSSVTAPPAPIPVGVPIPVRYVEGFPLWERLALGAVCGLLAPFLLGWAATENPKAGALLVLSAILLVALTVFAALRTRFWTAMASVSPEDQWLAAAVVWLGKALLIAGVVAAAVAIVIGILVVLVGIAIAVALIAIVFAAINAALDS